MSNFSFYGGRQGASFILRKSFSSVTEMVNAFRQGDSYEDVAFDEYVIISTNDLGNEDNGKIYRRGYDYTNDMGGAEYLCQIKGAGGASPHFVLTTVQDIEEKANQEGVAFTGQGEYSPTDGNLMPGKDGDTYNDSIKWAYCSVTNPDGTDTISYIGFQIPYTVIEYEADSVDTHYTGTLIEREDTSDHPFYEKWKVHIPKGVKGNTMNNLRVITASDSNVEDYNGKEDDVTNARDIVVYDEINYDNNEHGDVRTIYIGDYNMIENISMDSEGHITIHYTHGDDQIISVIARWITAVHLSPEGQLSIDYTTGESTTVENTLKWISNIQMQDNGSLIVNYNDGTSDTIQESIKWITSVTLANNGTFRIEYSGDEPAFETVLKFPTDIQLDTGTTEGAGSQKIQVTYNDGTQESIGNPLNYIMDVTINPANYHVLVLFSDPARRQSLQEQGQTVTYEGRDDWYDLGAVKDDSGILIGLNLPLSHFPDGTSNIRIVNQLNIDYPNGLPSDNVDLHGKIITVGDTDDQKKFFAYDYLNGTWYYVGDASAAGQVTQTQGVIVGYEDDDELLEQAEDLPIGTVWFIVED